MLLLQEKKASFRVSKIVLAIVIILSILRVLSYHHNNRENRATKETQSTAKNSKCWFQYHQFAICSDNKRGLTPTYSNDLETKQLNQPFNFAILQEYFLIQMRENSLAALSREHVVFDRALDTTKGLIYRFYDTLYFPVLLGTAALKKSTLHIMLEKITSLLAVAKRQMVKIIIAQIGGPEGGVLARLAFSYNSQAYLAIKPQVERAGLLHIFSISGYHLSILFALFFGLFKLLIRQKHAKIAALLLCISFVLLLGFKISVLRALAMMMVSIFSLYVYRQYSPQRTLVILAAVGLLLKPSLISSISFQLSFLATAAVLVSVPLLKKEVRDLASFLDLQDFSQLRSLVVGKRLVTDYLKQSILISMAVTICITPVMLYHFDIFYPIQVLSSTFISWMVLPLIFFTILLLCVELVHAFAVSPLIVVVLRKITSLFIFVMNSFSDVSSGFRYDSVTATFVVGWIVCFFLGIHWLQKKVKS